MNGSESTLAETLIAEGVFTEEQYMEVTDASEEPAEEEVRAVGSIAELMLGGRMILTRDLYMTNDVTLTNDFELDLNGFTIFGDTNTTQALNGDGIVITQTRCLELTVAHGVTAKLYNGNIKNAMFRNYGTITELSGLNTETQAGPGISNGGYISLIQRCMITGETIGLQNSGDIDLIDNCDITGHTYAAVTCVNGVSEWAATGKNRIAKITHSRMTGTNWERGIGFSGGNSMNAETLIEDCILVGYGWGGIQAYGYPITVRDSVIINASFGEFRAAVWYWDTGVTAPTMQNCVLIAEDGPCGYYLSGYVDLPFSGNGTCDFYQLSQVTDLSYYTYWQMQ